MSGTLLPSGLETHDLGTLAPNTIINGNWNQINAIFANTGDGAGILASAVTASGYPAGNQVVTLTGTQTLTNKTLTSPVINTPTLTGPILGTPVSGNLSNCTADGTNPVGSVTLGGTQTLTNKTLTSPTLTSPVLGTPASGNLTNCTVDGTNPVGNVTLTGAQTLSNKTLTAPILGTPASGDLANCTVGTSPVAKVIHDFGNITGDFTLALADLGKDFQHLVADTTTRTVTIPDNSSVAFAVGTIFDFYQEQGAGDLLVITTGDTLIPPDGPDIEPNTAHIVGQGWLRIRKVSPTKWIAIGYNIF